MKHFYAILCGLSLCAAAVNVSCSRVSTPTDVNYLTQFEATYFPSTSAGMERGELGVYLDGNAFSWSFRRSDMFNVLSIPLAENVKHLYLLEGKERVDSFQTDFLFNMMHNVPYSRPNNLSKSAQLMAKRNAESVLVTDGVSWGDSFSAPFLSEAFGAWLKQGHDVYILVDEANVKQKHYYICFTDASLEDNIYKKLCDELERCGEKDFFAFHLTASHPDFSFASGHTATVNPILSPTVKGYGDYEVEEWTIDWGNREGVIFDEVDMTRSDAPKRIEPVISGLKVGKKAMGGYDIGAVGLKVWNMNEAYSKYYEAMEQGTSVADSLNGVLCDGVYVVDEARYRSKGEVAIFIDNDNWSPEELLTGSPFNYTKIDVCVKDLRYDFSADSVRLMSTTMRAGKVNGGVAESVSATIRDHEVYEMAKRAMVYSIYVKCDDD